jgi:hypothetical protein
MRPLGIADFAFVDLSQELPSLQNAKIKFVVVWLWRAYIVSRK